jgi:HIV Tat-specific factor 1
MTSLYDQQPRIKMYTHPGSDNFKGEALVTFLREESVELACTLYDATPFNPGQSQLISVQPAHFNAVAVTVEEQQQFKGSAPPPDKRILQAAFAKMKAKLSWNQQNDHDHDHDHDHDGTTTIESKSNTTPSSCTVLVKGVECSLMTLTSEQELDNLEQVMQDFKDQCSEDYGTVKKVSLLDDMTIVVEFCLEKHAAKCVKGLNGRWYDGHQLTARLK